MSTPQLMDHFAFNQVDLQTNRNGQLSDIQKARLKAEQKSFRRWTLFTGLALIGGSLVFMTFFLSWRLVSPNNPASLCGLSGCLAPISIGTLLLVIGWRKSTQTLSKAVGPVKITREEHYDSDRQFAELHTILHIGAAAFRIEPEVATWLMQGELMTVYYIREEDKIMSLEKVGSTLWGFKGVQ
ncbi:MAG: hypothetical protein KA314_06605 [Chloroflexi bacterium]|nr:hypothetical protein [Chloroflexota bacterium]MBP8055495.1 hypothetical protein [Chloroflexota bacterium]